VGQVNLYTTICMVDAKRKTPRIVIEQIRAAILDGLYKPGEWLLETDVASKFTMSRYPDRRASRESLAMGLKSLELYRQPWPLLERLPMGRQVIRLGPTTMPAARSGNGLRVTGASTANRRESHHAKQSGRPQVRRASPKFNR
jgi:hypothetical protein